MNDDKRIKMVLVLKWDSIIILDLYFEWHLTTKVVSVPVVATDTQKLRVDIINIDKADDKKKYDETTFNLTFRNVLVPRGKLASLFTTPRFKSLQIF